MDVEKSAAGIAFRRGGEGLHVVLVHGIPGAGEAWRAVAAELGGGLDVIVPDLVGFGATQASSRLELETIGPAAQARMLAGLLDELGIAGALVVGHDFGVPVTVLLADARPDLVSRALLMAGNVFGDTPIPFPLSLVNAPVVGPIAARALFSPTALRLLLRQGVGPGSPPPDAATYIGEGTQPGAIATIFSSALTRLAEVYAPVEAALPRLRASVVVGWGSRDPFFGIDQARRTALAADAPLHIFDGAGHFLPHERPEEVAEQIEKLAAEPAT